MVARWKPERRGEGVCGGVDLHTTDPHSLLYCTHPARRRPELEQQAPHSLRRRRATPVPPPPPSGNRSPRGGKGRNSLSIHPPLTSGLGLFPPSAGSTSLLGKLALVLLLRTDPAPFFLSFHSSSTRLHPRRKIICVRPSAPTLRLCRRRPPPVLSLPIRKTVPVERPSPPYATLRSSLCDKGWPRGFSLS